MLRKKAFNRVFFTTIVFFIVFLLYSVKSLDNEIVNKKQNHLEETLYTLNDKYIVKTAVYIGKIYSLEDRIKEKLEIMTKENNKNYLLPSYFDPILPENTKVLDVKVVDTLVKVYFSKELENISENQAEQMIEAIIYTILDEDIFGVEIYVENKLLKYIPHTSKKLPAVLTKDFGINKDYSFYMTSNINKVKENYYLDCANDYCVVPITKYVSDDREKLEIVFDDLLSLKMDNKLISLIENTKLNSYKITDETIYIDLDNDLDLEELYLFTKSIFENYEVKNIEIFINGNKKYTKTLEN